MTAATLLTIAVSWFLASMAVGLPVCWAIRWAGGPEAGGARVSERPAVALPAPRPSTEDLDLATAGATGAGQLVQP